MRASATVVKWGDGKWRKKKKGAKMALLRKEKWGSSSRLDLNRKTFIVLRGTLTNKYNRYKKWSV